MPRETVQPRTSNEPFIARLLALIFRKTSNPWAGVGIAVVAALATFGVTRYWLTVDFGVHVQGQVIATGANETATEALLDGSEVSLRERSTLTVDETGARRIARLDAGEILFKAKATPERPVTVDTSVLTATVVADATFRVSASSWIEVEVYEGAVKLALKGAKPDAPVRWLHKGESFKTPIDGMRPALAERRDRISAGGGG